MKTILPIAALAALYSITSMQAGDVYKEPHVRNLIAEMQLGTPKEKYLSFSHCFHDYNCIETVAHLEAGIKVTNLDQFELKLVNNNPNIVYYGTEKRVDPFDICLNYDLPNQSGRSQNPE